jgi:indolepyruvate ferredoxin oxidoreductase alpha subunit
LKKHHEENVEIVKKEFAYNGVSVIIPRRECVETTRKKVKEKSKSKAK